MKASYSFVLGFQFQADLRELSAYDRRELLFALIREAPLETLQAVYNDLPYLIDHNKGIPQNG